MCTFILKDHYANDAYIKFNYICHICIKLVTQIMGCQKKKKEKKRKINGDKDAGNEGKKDDASAGEKLHVMKQPLAHKLSFFF